ncbi:MAG TPA: hypothetical protein VNL77_16160 [Roseiflexaceae bacterium]|nr:hypothetical protein [Roseiflexaceae bacterium]
MASPRKSAEDQRASERSVSRTYRAAIRLGEDFITLEETITLPIDASDEEVAQAVDLGWRIYQAQRAAVEGQIAGVRETAAAPQPITVRDPDAPASDKQRNYIAALQEDLAWSSEQLAAYARERSVDLVTITKGQASAFIDGLKKLAEERSQYGGGPARAEPAPSRASDGGPATDRQLYALEKLARQHGLALEAEVQRRYGASPQDLTAAQAAALLREWQQRPIPARRVPESAL